MILDIITDKIEEYYNDGLQKGYGLGFKSGFETAENLNEQKKHNKMKPKEMARYAISVMQAFQDGKDVEFRLKESKEIWVPNDNPTWDWSRYDYRVATAPNFVPFDNCQECLDAMVFHGISGWLKSKDCESIEMITYMDDNGMVVGAGSLSNADRYRTYDFYFKNYVFMDGHPFGKEVKNDTTGMEDF